ncbi:serine hydrolase domain-containing protein [Flavobacterium aestivum]|uniref:serine hydrolase domain-containing protein n=1 Tax=Flavobacterium aestivum TaxID=3003257 RepID=UPI002285D59D|nr:serine hydrolase domain-containing protein [Flavobacterium aestivum]
MKIFNILLATLLFHSSFAQRTREFTKVDSILQNFDKPNAPGFSIGIVENGKLIYSKGIGFANIDNQIKNSNSSIFGIASIAKQFTAACIWSLIKEGKIDLDDDIRKYIPEFPSYGKTIRIRHMLNHTSGIRNYQAIMELAGFDYDSEFHDNNTILKLACQQKELNNIPSEKVIYGNTAYTLLAIVIERITGKNLNQYAKEKIFTPLGMNHTFYRVDTTTLIPNKALGYVQNKDKNYVHLSSNQITYGAGSVGSSIEDLAKWSDVLNGLNSSYIDLTNFLITVETLPSGEIPKYARGVMVDEYKNIKTIHHSGYGLGGQSQIIAIPNLKLAIIILTNLEAIDPTPISYKILDLFLPDQNRDTSKSSIAYHHKINDLQKFVGQYKEQNSDMKMEILLKNDTLQSLSSQGKKPIFLLATNKGKFIRMNNPNVSYDFMPTNNTKTDLIVYFGGTPFYFSRATFIDPQTVNLTDYIGRYYSSELSVEYEIYIQDGSLFVNYPKHDKIKLALGQKDEFGNGQRVLYHFGRNKENNVIKFDLSAEGTVKNIEFNKK